MKNNKQTAKQIEDYTPEELEQLLAKKKQDQADKEEKERIAYEAKRDSLASELIQEAITLQDIIRQFKAKVHASMDEQQEALAKYGKMRSNSKGGFQIVDTEGLLMIKRRRDTEPRWDERSDKGVSLLKDFLGDVVKKRDVKLYEILLGFLEKNKQGDLEYASVLALLKHENKFKDPRWVEGLKLVKEGHHNYLKAYGYEFKTKVTSEDNPDGKWQSIILNFSSL
ncbi:DUF3164 family protein [Cellulophaga lytica]|uniref:DUF3164 family protein n=1 Tax=Cellulophaga lytica TaxID=979 RepID=UPI003CE48387